MRGDNQSLWYCVRQRAGPLVKECRALRPRLSRYDSREDRRDKNEIVRSKHTAVQDSGGSVGAAAGGVWLSGQPLYDDL